MSTTEATTAADTLQVVYIGQREYRGEQVRYAYELTDGTHWGGTKKPLVTGHPVGALVEVSIIDGDTGRFWTGGEKSPRLVGEHGTPEQRLAWEVEHRAVRQRQDDAASRRRLAASIGSAFEDQLRPVRDAIDSLPAGQRRAALAAVIAYLAR